MTRERLPYAEGLGLWPKSRGRPLSLAVKWPDKELLHDLAAISLEQPHLKPQGGGWQGAFANALRYTGKYQKRSKRALQREVQEAFAWLFKLVESPRWRKRFEVPVDISNEDAARELLRRMATASQG